MGEGWEALWTVPSRKAAMYRILCSHELAANKVQGECETDFGAKAGGSPPKSVETSVWRSRTSKSGKKRE